MPPRYSYWTILAGGLPTAFRAAERADLLPTFNRIREKHPDAQMKWFARGRLWESPEEAQADLQRERVRRDRDWRPGGEHRDPRQAFKKTRARDPRREHKPGRPEGTGQQPAGQRPTGQRPTGQRPTGQRPTGQRPTGQRPTGQRPTGQRPTGQRPTGQRPTGQRPTGQRPTGQRPTGARPHTHRPPGPPRKRQR
jgi:hypothetical protein